ncbi:MAG: 3-hydroxylacyl-ACP dehydratase [Gammaproteobacteria bacterium]|nr:3-hydroxylacyl-ACP dehydratase [Gammaproteobacteria bacterium]
MSAGWLPEEVLPHRAALLLLTRIVSWDATSLIGEIDVSEDCVLAEPGLGVPRWAAIEFMAQAVGAFDGVRLRQADQPVPPGYLLGTRQLDGVDDYFRPGTTLRVEVQQVLNDASGLGVFACRLIDGERSLSCQLTVYRPPAGALMS